MVVDNKLEHLISDISNSKLVDEVYRGYTSARGHKNNA